MPNRSKLRDLLEMVPLWAVDGLISILPRKARADVYAWIGRRVVLNTPALRERLTRNLKLVYPDLSAADLGRLRHRIAGNAGRVVFEMRDNARMSKWAHEVEIEGAEGLAAVAEAKGAGRGVLLVSGHFGRWDALRAALHLRGFEIGALYRPQNNRYFSAEILKNFELIGKPMFPKGKKGLRSMITHLKKGGMVAILTDQKDRDGVILPFMGHPATTSTVAAEIALKYGLPMIPAYGIREPDGITIKGVLEPPIPHTDAVTMTQAMLDSLAARIHANPEQWNWLHRRWDTTVRADVKRAKEVLQQPE